MSEEKKKYSLSTILIIGVIICILFFLLSVIILRYQLNKKFEARCEKIRAAGEPVTLRELSEFYGEVSDDENAALIYEDIFSLYKSPKDVYDIYVKEETAKGIAKDKLEFKTLETFQNNILFLGRGVDLTTNNGLPKKVKDATRMFLNANKSCLKLSRQLEQYSKCQFNLDFNRGYDMSLPHLSPSRAFAELLAVDMTFNSLKGESDRVLFDFREGMKLGHCVLNEPIMISHTAGNRINEVLIDALKISYLQDQFTDFQLKEIENIIKKNLKSSDNYRVYIGERVFALIGFDILPKFFGLCLTDQILYKISPIFGLDVLWKLKLLDFFDALLKIEQEENITKKYMISADLEKQYMNLSFIYRPLKLITPLSFIAPVLTLKAKLTTALIAIDIERYRFKYHKLPKDLNALVPEFFEKLPVDPFSGKSYKYRVGNFDMSIRKSSDCLIVRKINGFVVYSVGLNKVDDNAECKPYCKDIVYWVVNKAKNQNINKVLGVKKKDK